jgi:hypothetical protein
VRVLRSLLWIDCSAGLLNGAITLVFARWLSQLYAVPVALLLIMGVANVVYGTYSFSLARRAVRPRALIVLLISANALWAGLCLVAAFIVASTASKLGVAQLLVEGTLVGGLAALEWRNRERLLVAD